MKDVTDTATPELEGVDMVAIPPKPAVTTDDLVQWEAMTKQINALKDSEILLRKRIFEAFFPAPREGTNTAPLAAGWVLKGTYPITRDIDQAALAVMKAELEAQRINVDAMIEYKPSLKVGVYKELTEEQRMVFDRCLIIKPGAPGIKIELPAKAKKAGA